MSAQDKLAQKVRLLQQRAATGDVSAQAELKKLGQLIAQYRRAMHEQREREAAEQLAAIEDAEEEVVGEAPSVPVYMDKLDTADLNMARTGHLDQLSQKVVHQQNQWSQLADVAPFSRTNPPSVLRGTLGNQATLITGPTATPQQRNQQVALWEGEDAETTPVTVTLGPVNGRASEITLGATVPWLDPYAIVQFGTRGFSALAEVDIGNGCQFTLTASSVSLQLALGAPPTGVTEIAGTFQAGGMLSFGATDRNPCPVTRTKFLWSIPQPTAFSTVSVTHIPAFAKRVWVFVTDATATTPAYQIIIAGNSNIYFTQTVAGNVGPQLFTLPNGTDWVQIVNNNVGTTMDATLVFELEF